MEVPLARAPEELPRCFKDLKQMILKQNKLGAGVGEDRLQRRKHYFRCKD